MGVFGVNKFFLNIFKKFNQSVTGQLIPIQVFSFWKPPFTGFQNPPPFRILKIMNFNILESIKFQNIESLQQVIINYYFQCFLEALCFFKWK